MEAFKFFETGYDPFIKQKFNGLIDALSYIEDVSSRLPNLQKYAGGKISLQTKR